MVIHEGDLIKSISGKYWKREVKKWILKDWDPDKFIAESL